MNILVKRFFLRQLKFLIATFVLCSLSAQVSAYAEVQPGVISNDTMGSDEVLVNNKAPKEQPQPQTAPLKGGVTDERVPVQKSKLEIWLQPKTPTESYLEFKEKLKEKGIDYKVVYVDDYFQTITRARNRADVLKYNGFLKSYIEFDTEKLGLWNGGKAHITFPHKFGPGVSSSAIPSAISYSNIYARPFVALGEFWYEQSMLDDKLKIKIGKQDTENDYAVLDDSYNFINGGLSEDPTIPLPAITKTAIGVSTTISPTKSTKIRAGVFDGNAKRERLGFGTLFTGNYFEMIEGEAKYSIKEHPGVTKVGFWYRNGDINEISPYPETRNFQSNYGVYYAARQMLFKENKNPKDEQGLYSQTLFGWRPTDRNDLAQFYGLGLQYKGLLPNRNEDIAGIGTDLARLNKRADLDQNLSHESFIESFYRIQINKFLAIQPDLQVAFKPNGDGKTTWLLGIRTFISF